MQEEAKVITAEVEPSSAAPEIKAPRESVSKTMIKKLRSMNKDQLVSKLIEIHNYAEQQKAANMMLMYKVGQLSNELKKHSTSQEVAAETNNNASEEAKNENV